MLSDAQTQWTHDPRHAPTGEFFERAGKTFFRYECPGGWLVVLEESQSGFDRCGILHPVGDIGGSCGAPKGHECPHTWAWYDWQMVSVSRTIGTKVAV